MRVGNAVRMRSGGPVMALGRIEDAVRAVCWWVSGDEVVSGIFALAALEVVEVKLGPGTCDAMVVGEMVRLKSGGPDMVVVGIALDTRALRVAWIAQGKGKPYSAVYPEACLKRVGGVAK